MRTRWLVALAGAALAAPLAGQAFPPPPVQHANARGTRLGLLGFGVRTGLDFKGDGQLVAAVSLDVGNLFLERFRLRPSAEIGIQNGPNTYAASFEMLYRFAADAETVTPYLGGGLAAAGHAACGADPTCPALWVNAVLGFEVHFHSTFNWLLEYRGMDAFRHNRLCLGLATRRGN